MPNNASVISRSVEINITGFSDWGLAMLGLGSLTQSPVTSHQSLVPFTTHDNLYLITPSYLPANNSAVITIS